MFLLIVDIIVGLEISNSYKLLYFILFFFITCRYIIVVEHDLSVLDYLSDFICCLYGEPGAYGVVTMPFSVREGKYIEGFPPGGI